MKLYGTLILGLICSATAQTSNCGINGQNCNDGNTDNGDGCSSTCQVEADYTCEGPSGSGHCSPGACTDNGGTFTCTCPTGYHGADTVADKSSFSCATNPTGVGDWIIENDGRGLSEQINYDSGSTTLKLGFQKSGGRDHRVTLYNEDCSTLGSTSELISVGAATSHGKGTTTDSKKVEYFKVPLSFNLAQLSTSSFLSTDKTKVEFCVKVELEDSNDDGVNFLEVRIKMTIDLSATLTDAITQIKRGDVVLYESETVTNSYTLDACQCSSTATIQSNDRCLNPSGSPAITEVKDTTRLTQSDILGICVSNEEGQGETIQITKILTLTLTQGSTTMNVISSNGDTVNPLSEYDAIDKLDHIHRANTRITSNFFTISEGNTNPDDITISGTAEIAFKTSGGRRLHENGRSLQTAEQPVGKFSFNVNLAKDSEDASEDAVSAAIAQILGVPLATAAIFTL